MKNSMLVRFDFTFSFCCLWAKFKFIEGGSNRSSEIVYRRQNSQRQYDSWERQSQKEKCITDERSLEKTWMG
jgi:hypothetical protein